MSKRNLIAMGVVAVVVVAGLVWALLAKNQGQKSPLSPTSNSKTEAPAEKEKTYTDTSGFSFKHPESITVEDITPEDDAHYALLSLTSKTKKDGPLTITIVDTNYKTLDEWLAKDPTAPKGATLAGATTLSGIAAKQYTGAGNFWTVAIDSGILYLIEGPKDTDYWDKVQDLVASSFTIGKPQAAQPTTGGSSDGTIYEEEEVIE